MIEILLLTALVVSTLLLVYPFVIYPALLFGLSRFVSDNHPDKSAPSPSVALVIAAYNEEDVIEEKINNSLLLDYPNELLSIIVFSDASSDDTDDIVRSYEDEGVELIRIEGRVGKTECQNRIAEMVEEDIIVFSDANSMYERHAIEKLVDAFSPDIGCVVGELKYRDSSEVEGESFYWKYESMIKHLESRLNSSVTGNGSIYAVRNSSYVPLSRGAISDFAEPLAIISNGERVRYAPEAIAWEHTGSSIEEELKRRSRIVTRSWHTVANFVHLLSPLRYPVFSFQLASHKVLRWLTPVFLALALTSNVALVAVEPRIPYIVFLALQFAMYTLAAIGWVLDQWSTSNPIICHIPYYFLVSNYGMARGFWNFLLSNNIVTWDTADRG